VALRNVGGGDYREVTGGLQSRPDHLGFCPLSSSKFPVFDGLTKTVSVRGGCGQDETDLTGWLVVRRFISITT
jgi:hypothetical protein